MSSKLIIFLLIIVAVTAPAALSRGGDVVETVEPVEGTTTLKVEPNYGRQDTNHYNPQQTAPAEVLTQEGVSL